MTTSASTMMEKIEQYLVHKRSMGYKMIKVVSRLRAFARYADLHAPAGPLTVDLALRWATSSKGTKRITQIRLLGIVRSLARYLAMFDPQTEIPPQQMLGAADSRIPPHIYTRREITALIRDVLISRR